MQYQHNFQLVQEQKQKLVMTQQLRQAINILQYSAVELNEYVQQASEVNPLLELDYVWSGYASAPKRDDVSPVEFATERVETLTDFLNRQLAMVPLSREKLRIGKYLIGLIDRNGYLHEDLEEVSQELNAPSADVESLLSLIQSFEPVGVGARSLVESLHIQCKSMGLDDPLLSKVITDHLDDLAENRYPTLAKTYDVSVAEIKRIADVIKTLQPKPGTYIGDPEIRYIIPDVIVEQNGEDLLIYINDDVMPRLQVNSFYRELLKSGDVKGETKDYINGCLKEATWMIRSIAQRRATILRVTEAIFRHQHRFLADGVKGLQPLTLQHIANEIDVHESTVSRATTGKYVQTPRGVLELKAFFGGGLSNQNGEVIAVQRVKEMIRTIIDEEDKEKPLSDQKIVESLTKHNINISRRTVVKYRDEMNIPASNRRRRYG